LATTTEAKCPTLEIRAHLSDISCQLAGGKAALVDLINKKRSGRPITKKYRLVGGNVVDPIETQLGVSCLDGRWA
jgi:hypothetical protein